MGGLQLYSHQPLKGPMDDGCQLLGHQIGGCGIAVDPRSHASIPCLGYGNEQGMGICQTVEVGESCVAKPVVGKLKDIAP